MLRLQLSCSQLRQRLLRQSRERATWCIAGMGMAFCPATARPHGSNGNGRKIAARLIGMVARAFIEGAGPVADSARAGRRRRSGMYGIAVYRGSRPNPNPKRPQRGHGDRVVAYNLVPRSPQPSR